MTEQIDGLEELYERLYRQRSGWHWIVNPETGIFALLPETAKDVSAWERRAIQMHAAQEPLTLAPKPTENAMTRIERGD